MPDFVAALAAATLFCASVPILNGLTRVALRMQVAPLDLAENGFLQYGLALALSWLLWIRSVRRVSDPARSRGVSGRIDP